MTRSWRDNGSPAYCGHSKAPEAVKPSGKNPKYRTNSRTIRVNHMPKVIVDYEKCNADWTCIEVCPVEVFEKGKHNDKEVSIPANPDACLVCMACVEQCPESAIIVEE
ncbi:MAG: ferredoxin family protein [Candidatus Bathyarchaeota archaeon]|nr:ferredoxin family protein [Candidatus Bathyarchaeota archaeon]